MNAKHLSITYDLPIHLIQSLRLIQALMESDFNVVIPAHQEGIFQYLENYFELSYSVDPDGSKLLQELIINHATPTPETRIGSISRPVIFPHAILDRCRELWPTVRDIDFSFLGLVTEDRRGTLNQWLKQSKVRKRISGIDMLATRFSRKFGIRILPAITIDASQSQAKVIIKDSLNGRGAPQKFWDEDYYDLMLRTKFSLCPNGDFIWTYRFFEAIMCGSIPVIEDNVPAYQDYFCYRMADPISDFKWSSEVVERNFELCKKQLTINKDELNVEIASLLKAKDPKIKLEELR